MSSSRIVGLEDKRKSLVRRLSGGQVRRLDTALALAGDPELLFLDEPTSGFDPAARRDAWEMIAGLRDLGKTILLTTHYMDEAERLSDRLAVIAAGRIVAEGTVESLREQHAGHRHLVPQTRSAPTRGHTAHRHPSTTAS